MRGFSTRVLPLLLALCGPAPAAEDADLRDLHRLSEILGALSHLDGLCHGETAGALWREKMSNVLGVEPGDADRRRRLVSAFNRSRREFAALYRRCTPNAEAIIDAYLAEGAELSTRLSAD
jgi:TIGR02301 family protein